MALHAKVPYTHTKNIRDNGHFGESKGFLQSATRQT